MSDKQTNKYHHKQLPIPTTANVIDDGNNIDGDGSDSDGNADNGNDINADGIDAVALYTVCVRNGGNVVHIIVLHIMQKKR